MSVEYIYSTSAVFCMFQQCILFPLPTLSAHQICISGAWMFYPQPLGLNLQTPTFPPFIYKMQNKQQYSSNLIKGLVLCHSDNQN